MTVYIVGLEQHEQRYTAEWAVHVPQQVQQALPDERVRVIQGLTSKQQTSAGAFLNFATTNVFKAEQIIAMARLFDEGEVIPGDCFVFTDAWHYGVTALRYMSDLLRVPVRIVSLVHAGSHDPHDFLGRVPDVTWLRHFERSLFQACDLSVFATEFHIDLFKQAHSIQDDARILRAGWPMEYLRQTLAQYTETPKEQLVLFPHRVAPEKQVEIFKDLAPSFPGYEFRVCQDERLSKQEYHQLLGRAVAVFSASLQETLGIGLYEGLLCGALPFAPDRLSYSEMYPEEWLYPPEWTASWSDYQQHKPQLISRLQLALSSAESVATKERMRRVSVQVEAKFFDGSRLYAALAPSA